jgi:hypothetical protein
MNARTGARLLLLVSLVLLSSNPAAATLPLIEMNSRETPSDSARPLPKQYSVDELAAAPKFVLASLPAPSGKEPFARKLSTPAEAESLSFGREPMQLGVDGRIDVPAGIAAIRVEINSATALHLRSAWRSGR